MSGTLTDEELLARLIAFDTTSHRSNRPVADFLCDYLEGGGIEIIRDESADGEKVNLIAMTGPDPDPSGSGLILCGHLDTVPATEPEWTSDPFALTKRDGSYFGRGTCDMKGFDAIAVNIFREADHATLKHPLALILTCDEEIGSRGAQRLVRSLEDEKAPAGGLASACRRLPRSAVIGEPTSLSVVRMHKGHMTMRLVVRGRAAHSGSPHLGAGAIEPAGELIRALADLRRRLEARRTDTSRFFPEVPFPVLSIAHIAGGAALNVVPETCTIDVGIRLLPGEDSNASRAMLEAIVTRARETQGSDLSVSLELINDNPPMLLEESAEIHRTLCAIVGQADSRGVSFASDAGWLSQMGLECVLFGPGSIEVAHRPDEHLPIEEFTRARTILEQVVQRTCH